MTLVAFFYETITTGMDVFSCDDETEGIILLTEAMKAIKNDKILDTARRHAEQLEINQALQCLDAWVDEYNNKTLNTFHYIIKDL